MEFINTINNNKTSISQSNEKINNNKSNVYEYLNNININNEVYKKPKLILSHNISKNCLINKNDVIQREISFEKLNKKFYYSQANNIHGKSKIDSIQLNFNKDKDKDNSYFKKKLNKNFSHEIYKKSKRCIKSNKNLQKSYSQKMLNIDNNDSSYNKDINKEKSLNKNYIIMHSENSQYIPTKNISNEKKQNDNSNICITNNEEFQIIPKIKIIDNSNNKNNDIINIIKKNNVEKSDKDKKNFKNFDNCEEISKFPLKINIKVNKIENIENKTKKTKEFKEYKKENAFEEKEILKKEIYIIKSKHEFKKNDSSKNFISKYNKDGILLKKNERKNILNNNKDKDKEFNNSKSNSNANFKRRKIFKYSSQEDLFRQSNKSIQTKISDNNKLEKTDKKNVSIRNRYKTKTKHK